MNRATLSRVFANGSWYTSRAFNPVDKGGQPTDFPLGIMQFPAVPGGACNECRSIAIGGSYVANAETKSPKEVIAFFNSFLTPEVGNLWLDHVKVQMVVGFVLFVTMINLRGVKESGTLFAVVPSRFVQTAASASPAPPPPWRPRGKTPRPASGRKSRWKASTS